MCIAVSGVNLIAVGRAEGVGWAGGEGVWGRQEMRDMQMRS